MQGDDASLSDVEQRLAVLLRKPALRTARSYLAMLSLKRTKKTNRPRDGTLSKNPWTVQAGLREYRHDVRNYCARACVSREARWLALHMFDTFLSRQGSSSSMSFRETQSVCFVCARLASKYHDKARLPAHFKGDFLRTMWGDKSVVDAFAPRALRDKELALMRALDWTVDYVSPVEIAAHVLATISDTRGDKGAELRHNVGVLLDAAFFADSLVLGFAPAEIALGAIALARKAARLSFDPVRALLSRLGTAWPEGRVRHCAKQLRVLHVLAQMEASCEAVDTSWGYLEPVERNEPAQPARAAMLSDTARDDPKSERVATPTSIARFIDWGYGEGKRARDADARQQDRCGARTRTCGTKRKRGTETVENCHLLTQHEVLRRLEPMQAIRALIEPHGSTSCASVPVVKDLSHVLKCDSEGMVGVNIAKPGRPLARGGIVVVEVPASSDNGNKVEPLDEIVEIDGTCVRKMELCEVLHLFKICATRATDCSSMRSGIPVVLRRVID